MISCQVISWTAYGLLHIDMVIIGRVNFRRDTILISKLPLASGGKNA